MIEISADRERVLKTFFFFLKILIGLHYYVLQIARTEAIERYKTTGVKRNVGIHLGENARS
jgi:hypothetical protein